MRLLHTDTLQFSEYVSPSDAPPYIIASHRWLQDEVSYHEFLKDRINVDLEIQSKAGIGKILRFCDYIKGWQAHSADGEVPHYLWIDTCCINKDSSAELQEAITSMFEWYAQAWCCLAWLHDVKGDVAPLESTKAFSNSVWFTRGWTLQELLAPKTVVFLDEQWHLFGHKSSTAGLLALASQIPIATDWLGNSLNRLISQITKIDEAILWEYANVRAASIQERQSWMNKRRTTRREDRAYCMLGICEVFMPLNYGEGSNAEKRLERKIRKRDQNEGTQHQPLSLSEKEQILNRAVFNWKQPPVTESTQSTSTMIAPAAHVDPQSGLSLEGLKLIMLLEVWLSHPGQHRFMASKWARTPQQYEDLKRHLRQDKQQRFVLRLPPSGDMKGSYIMKRGVRDGGKDATDLMPKNGDWAEEVLQAIGRCFHRIDRGPGRHRSSGEEHCLAVAQFISDQDQLPILRKCILDDPGQRYWLSTFPSENPEVESHRNESELETSFIHRRDNDNPSPTRLHQISKLLISLLSHEETQGSNGYMNLQDVLNHPALQDQGIMFAELASYLRKDEKGQFEVLPSLPDHNSAQPERYHVRANMKDRSPPNLKAMQDCTKCQESAPINRAFRPYCSRDIPMCTVCVDLDRTCEYRQSDDCIACSEHSRPLHKQCDREKVCSNCAEEGVDCRYVGRATDTAPVVDLQRLTRRMTMGLEASQDGFHRQTRSAGLDGHVARLKPGARQNNALEFS